LKSKEGDILRCGIADEGLSNDAHIVTLDKQELKIELGSFENLLRVDKPRLDLTLAIPRPLRLERLLPVISCLGVDQLTLIGASKVEKDYFGETSSTVRSIDSRL
jgi:16S rRNA U1498 N3-methylase RsmE